jgi:hypothetical protein
VVGPSEVVTPPRSRLCPSPGFGRGGDRRPEVEVESEPGGRARRRPSSEVEVESEPWGRARRRPSSESRLSPSPRFGRGGDRRPKSRLSPNPGVGRGGDHRPRSRWSPSPGVRRGGDSYGARGWTWLLSASPWRVAQQSEQRRRRCFPVRSVSGGAK